MDPFGSGSEYKVGVVPPPSRRRRMCNKIIQSVIISKQRNVRVALNHFAFLPAIHPVRSHPPSTSLGLTTNEHGWIGHTDGRGRGEYLKQISATNPSALMGG